MTADAKGAVLLGSELANRVQERISTTMASPLSFQGSWLIQALLDKNR
jgi:hypothetical protein